MSRRLKPVKDLCVLILAPRKHDRLLWADLLRNCGIDHVLSMADIGQASDAVGAGQVDVVFVDEAYGAQGIVDLLIPARLVEFAGGRGVCLVLCAKQATAQDVLNARKLGFASVVILPASTETVRKHLELASRFIPAKDEELDWSAPKLKAQHEAKALPEARMDPNDYDHGKGNEPIVFAQEGLNEQENPSAPVGPASEELAPQPTPLSSDMPTDPATPANNKAAQKPAQAQEKAIAAEKRKKRRGENEDLAPLDAPGRSARSAEEEVVFL